MSGARWFIVALLACLPTGAALAADSAKPDVAFGGFAFAGDAASMRQRFPESLRYEDDTKARGTTMARRISALVAKHQPAGFRLIDQIDDVNARDQAIVTALVVTSETMSLEQFGKSTKVLALVRAQAMFFDFKSRSVLRAYPLSFAVIDVLDHRPSAAESQDFVRRIYEGSQSKPGILERYANVLATATLPTGSSRTLQVHSVDIKPAYLAILPPSLGQDAGVAQAWAADIVAEAIASRTGVPMLPSGVGYAIGNVMALKFSNGDVFNLRIPDPDYQVNVELTGVKKVRFSEAAAGASYVYGTYAAVRIEEPVSGKLYMNAAFKNGEVKVVPATQTEVDDFPAYYDSVNGLFKKLADAIAGQGLAWVKTATAAADIDKQISDTNRLIQSCK